jgi:hypothetical protein
MNNAPEMKPPWLEFPMYPPGSMGWRMGHGEKYREEWDAWFAKLWPMELREEYAAQYPEPEEWRGYYARYNPQPTAIPIVRLSRQTLFKPLP